MSVVLERKQESEQALCTLLRIEKEISEIITKSDSLETFKKYIATQKPFPSPLRLTF